MRINDKEKILAHFDESEPENSLYYNQFILPFSIEVNYSADSEKEKYEKENEILDNFANSIIFKKAYKKEVSGQLEDYFFDNYFELYDLDQTSSVPDTDLKVSLLKERVSKARIFNYTVGDDDSSKESFNPIGEYVYTSKNKASYGLKLSLDVNDVEARVLKINGKKASIENDNEYSMTVLVVITISCYKNGLSKEEEENLVKIGDISEDNIHNDIEKMLSKSNIETYQGDAQKLEKLQRLVIKQKFIKFVGDKFKILYDMAEVNENYDLSLKLDGMPDVITLKKSKKHLINDLTKDLEKSKDARTKETKKELLYFLDIEKILAESIEDNSKENGLLNLQNTINLLNGRRMFSNITIQNTKIKFKEIDYFNLEEEIKSNKNGNFDDMILYSNLDYGYPTIQNGKFLKDFLDKSAYLRWTNYGTLYISSSIANVMLCDESAPFYLVSNQHTIYQELYLLVLIQSLLLNSFHDELLGAKNQLENLSDIIDEFHEDANRWIMFKVSSEIQGIELYEQYQTGLSVKELYEKLSAEVSAIQATLGNRDTKQVNETVDRLTNRANAIAYISLIVAAITFVYSIPSQYATATGTEFAAYNNTKMLFEDKYGSFTGRILTLLILMGISLFVCWAFIELRQSIEEKGGTVAWLKEQIQKVYKSKKKH